MRDYIVLALVGVCCFIVAVFVIVAVIRYFVFILAVFLLAIFIGLFLQAVYPILPFGKRKKRRRFR